MITVCETIKTYVAKRRRSSSARETKRERSAGEGKSAKGEKTEQGRRRGSNESKECKGRDPSRDVMPIEFNESRRTWRVFYGILIPQRQTNDQVDSADSRHRREWLQWRDGNLI